MKAAVKEWPEWRVSFPSTVNFQRDMRQGVLLLDDSSTSSTYFWNIKGEVRNDMWNSFFGSMELAFCVCTFLDDPISNILKAPTSVFLYKRTPKETSKYWDCLAEVFIQTPWQDACTALCTRISLLQTAFLDCVLTIGMSVLEKTLILQPHEKRLQIHTRYKSTTMHQEASYYHWHCSCLEHCSVVHASSSEIYCFPCTLRQNNCVQNRTLSTRLEHQDLCTRHEHQDLCTRHVPVVTQHPRYVG